MPNLVRMMCVLTTVASSSIAIGQGSAGKSDPMLGKVVALPTGVVTGRVVFADTNGPARFSKVLLKASKAAEADDNPFAALARLGDDDEAKPGKTGAPAKPKLSAADEADKKKQAAASNALFSAIADMMVSTTVAGDGTYSFSNVKPGTYYLHVLAPGYVDPLSQFSPEDLSSTDPAIRKKIAAVATAITVTGSDPVRADMRLDRGADISGRVLYSDGTPATGWIVRTVHPQTTGSGLEALGMDTGDLDLSHASEASTTDDLGHFRVAGLATGSYVLQARLTAGAPGRSSLNPRDGGGAALGVMASLLGLKLTVYSGDVVRQGDARPISVRAGEDRNGADIIVPLGRYRTVTGVVRAKADGHPVTGGAVDLTAIDAQGKEDGSLHWNTGIARDGTFHFDYVPGPGTFTVKVSHAVDSTEGTTKQIFGSLVTERKTTHSYGSASAPVLLGDGDVLDLKLDVPEVEAPN